MGIQRRRSSAGTLIVAIIIASLSGLVSPAARADGANDDYTDPAVVGTTASIVVSGDNTVATGDAGQDAIAGDPGGASIWWSWTAPYDGTVTIETCESDFHTLLGVGSASSGGPFFDVAQNDGTGGVCPSDPPRASVRFTAVAGNEYRIAVDGSTEGGDPARGSISLGIQMNADFAHAATIPVLAPHVRPSVHMDGTTYGAASPVWFDWAGTPGRATVCDDSGTTSAVFTGSSIGSLASVTNSPTGDEATWCSGSFFTFAAQRGVVYHIRSSTPADGHAGLTMYRPVPNNDLADATPLPSSTYSAVIDPIFGATNESGEPNEGGDGHSVWYSWTSPVSEAVTLDVCAPSTHGSGVFDFALSVYTGSTIGGLSLVEQSVTPNPGEQCGTGNVNPWLSFNATKGTTYRFAVDVHGSRATHPAVLFRLHLEAPPGNDDFANAESLPIHTGDIVGANVQATKETGEPDHAGVPGGASVWYVWTAPSSAPTTVETCGTTFSAVVGVYTGTSVDALSTVPGGSEFGEPCSDGHDRRELLFPAVAGTTYHIAVDGEAGATGNIALQFRGPQSNDNIADAKRLSGSSVSIADDNYRSGTETGEPPTDDGYGDTAGATLWYVWKPPASGAATLSGCGTRDVSSLNAFPTFMAVYTRVAGNLVVAAKREREDDGSLLCRDVRFGVSNDTDYLIQLDGKTDQNQVPEVLGRGAVSLRLDLAAETTPPAASIDKIKVKGHKVTATLSATDPAPASPPFSFQCQIDAKASAPCASTARFNVKPGKHVLTVVATDAAGNPSPAVTRRFRVR